jgi:hypothetical protein
MFPFLFVLPNRTSVNIQSVLQAPMPVEKSKVQIQGKNHKWLKNNQL